MKRLSFGADMVRAILDGRKTVTRRPVKIPKVMLENYSWGLDRAWVDESCMATGHPCLKVPQETPNRDDTVIRIWPLHAPGDSVLMAEALVKHEGGFIEYEADGDCPWDVTQPCVWPWKVKRLAARYCPTDLCRRRLEIVSARPEHIDFPEIDHTEALLEGFATVSDFYSRWQAMYGGTDYDAVMHPWVWRYEFTAHEIGKAYR